MNSNWLIFLKLSQRPNLSQPVFCRLGRSNVLNLLKLSQRPNLFTYPRVCTRARAHGKYIHKVRTLGHSINNHIFIWPNLNLQVGTQCPKVGTCFYLSDTYLISEVGTLLCIGKNKTNTTLLPIMDTQSVKRGLVAELVIQRGHLLTLIRLARITRSLVCWAAGIVLMDAKLFAMKILSYSLIKPALAVDLQTTHRFSLLIKPLIDWLTCSASRNTQKKVLPEPTQYGSQGRGFSLVSGLEFGVSFRILSGFLLVMLLGLVMFSCEPVHAGEAHGALSLGREGHAKNNRVMPTSEEAEKMHGLADHFRVLQKARSH